MRELNGVYTQAFNRRYARIGHVLQGRFKGLLVDKDAYLLELCRYVVLNPVRAGMVERPANWVVLPAVRPQPHAHSHRRADAKWQPALEGDLRLVPWAE